MHIESRHRALKRDYFDSKSVRRLDIAVRGLMNITRDQQFKRILSVETGVVSHKLRELKSRHDTATKSEYNIFQTEIDEVFLISGKKSRKLSSEKERNSMQMSVKVHKVQFLLPSIHLHLHLS